MCEVKAEVAKYLYVDDIEKVRRVQEAIEMKKQKYGEVYCPCVTPLAHSEATICPCKEYRETGICRCGMYKE